MFFYLQRLCIITLAIWLAACSSSMPPRQTAPSTPPTKPATSAPANTAPTPANNNPAANGAIMGGPKVINIDPKPETTGNPTDGIDPNTPLETSVTPKLEPIVKGTTKPYIVNGETMTPMTEVSTPFTQTGHASWYGKKFHGRRTASGEPYDMFKLTAAHRTLPIPSYVRITNLSNGKTIMARVNDRGPFGRDRIIDLSYAAAKQLDIIRHGSAQVEVSLIDPTQQTQPLQPSTQPVASNAPLQANTAPAAASTSALTTLEAGGIYVQVGAFGQEENADRLHQRIFTTLPETQSLLNKVYNGKTFQIVLGPYPDHALAAQAASQMRDKLQLPALIFSR
jgi:rare lipoprotein A